MAATNVDETARHQSVAFEDLMIVLQADFIVGAASEIIEDELWQAPLGEDAVVFDVEGFRGHGALRQNSSARVGTSIRVGAREPSAAVSACSPRPVETPGRGFHLSNDWCILVSL